MFSSFPLLLYPLKFYFFRVQKKGYFCTWQLYNQRSQNLRLPDKQGFFKVWAQRLEHFVNRLLSSFRWFSHHTKVSEKAYLSFRWKLKMKFEWEFFRVQKKPFRLYDSHRIRQEANREQLRRANSAFLKCEPKTSITSYTV